MCVTCAEAARVGACRCVAYAEAAHAGVCSCVTRTETVRRVWVCARA